MSLCIKCAAAASDPPLHVSCKTTCISCSAYLSPADTLGKLLTTPPICAGIIVTPLAPTYTWGAQSVRIFDSDHRNYSQVATMSSLRWYPTVMTFADGNMLILGGNQAVSPPLRGTSCTVWMWVCGKCGAGALLCAVADGPGNRCDKS